MSRAAWDRLAHVFVDALQQSSDTRDAFVAEVCGGDDELRAQVLSLLKASDEAGPFLSAPALDALAREVVADGWTLQPGDRVGAYTVLTLLGAGGTGEVWRARDERLGRDVALKVLLRHLVRDAGVTRRFAEEARAAGSLHHPNIPAVYDVGEHHGAPFIVSECLEGESLRRRLRNGSLGAPETIAIGRQIAAGLAAAHGRGIVHRDLKPDNIFLTVDDGVKILDFGLAKLYEPDAEPATTAARLTVTGVIVGTAGYMAPEQATGRPVDPRTDLFALGATLYEMLSGRRAFAGASVVETLHAIVADAPEKFDPDRAVPNALEDIVFRLLEKDPNGRFQSAARVEKALELAAQHSIRQSIPARVGGLGQWRLAFGAIAGAALIAGSWWIRGTSSRDMVAPVTQFEWSLPAPLRLESAPVVSPDGQWVAMAAADGERRRLYTRTLRSLEATPLAGTDGATAPFWAPDSAALGFFANGKLMTVRLSGGPATMLCDAPDPRGASWGASDTIVFAPRAGDAVAQVSARGGAVTAVTVLDARAGETAHQWPAFLPDGRQFVFFAVTANGGRLRRGRLDAPRALEPWELRSDSPAVVVPARGGGALLLTAAAHSIAVRAVDASSRVSDEVRTLPLSALEDTASGALMLGASAQLLAFAGAVPSITRLGAIDRTGMALWGRDEPQPEGWPRLSPDGRWLARQRVDPVHARSEIVIEDLTSHAQHTLTPGADAGHPVWSPDGRFLAYATGAGESSQLTIAAVDSRAQSRTLRCPGAHCEPTDWSPDGERILVNVRGVDGADVWAVWADANSSAQPVLASTDAERDARLSPDGQWVAYVAEKSGRTQVKVRRVSGPSDVVTLSPDGDQPIWRRDGRELLFIDAEQRLQAASITPGRDRLSIGASVRLAAPALGSDRVHYDLSPDGQRIYVLDTSAPAPPRQVRFVLGWQGMVR